MSGGRRRGRLLAVLLAVLAALAAGCGADDPPDFVALSWRDFDQNPDGGWRPLADRRDFAGAARMIDVYLEHREDLPPAQRGYSTWHAGQLWALHGDTAKALFFMDRATVDEIPEGFPRAFNDLVVGTRRFLRGDMDGVRAARERVAAMPGLAPRDSHFLGALEHLERSEGLTYLEIFDQEMAEE